MIFMAPRKRKATKASLEEEKPEISVDLSEEEIKEKLEELDKAEELSRTIKQIIGSSEKDTTTTLPSENETEKTEKKDKKKEDRAISGEKIKQNVDKIKAKEGIIGYILRNSTSASIDLKDPTKIIDFAVLSSSAFEASVELSETFELGDVKHVLIEGNTIKLLSFTAEGNKVSVFMDKDVDHNRVFKDLLS